MTRIGITAVLLASLLAITSVAVLAQTKATTKRGDGVLAYSTQARWLSDAYESIPVLRDRASCALRQMGFDVEQLDSSRLKATRRDSSLDLGSMAGGSELAVTCKIEREPGTELIIHLVSFTADAKYFCHLGKHPYSGTNSARERLELAQSRVARAISTKRVAELELVDADSLRPYVDSCITLRGRAINQKDGVFIAAEGVEVELPSDARDLFKGGHEQDMKWTGILRLVYESHWYKDPNENLNPGEGVVQSKASHQTPVRFRLDP